MSIIDFKSLNARLSATITRKGQKYLEERVNTLIHGKYGLKNIAYVWKEEFKKVLSRPASTRGYYKQKLRPNTTSNPMLVTGHLMDALYTRITHKISKGNAEIQLHYGFGKLPAKKFTTSNYGDYLNESHSSIVGFKERAYSKLNEAIAHRLMKGGYN